MPEQLNSLLAVAPEESVFLAPFKSAPVSCDSSVM